MLIIESQSLDIYRNLAIEEYLMEYLVDCGPILFLWQSDGAVVMGKNQNPWKECRLDLMHNDDVSLARRISGGGTVYHDIGNLNYCIIVDREAYREKQAYELIQQALATLNICAEQTGKSNLSVDGLKFSGNAFCFRKGRALHHGTLLLNTRLDRLHRYLGSCLDAIDTRAIPSEPTEVTNLNIDIETISSTLKTHFKRLYHTSDQVKYQSDSFLPEHLLNSFIKNQISKKWLYETTPPFSVQLPECTLKIVKGIIVKVNGGSANGLLNTPFINSSFSLLCNLDFDDINP